MEEIKFYTMNLDNSKNIIEKKAIKNLRGQYSEDELSKITNYDEIGIVEYVANNNYFIYKNKIYAGYMIIEVLALLDDGTRISGCEFAEPLYNYGDYDLCYIPDLKELQSKYGEELETVKNFEVIISNVTESWEELVEKITYKNNKYKKESE